MPCQAHALRFSGDAQYCPLQLQSLLCGTCLVVRSILCEQSFVQLPHASIFWSSCKNVEIEAEANLDVFLRQVISVNEDFADLVSGVGILAFVGVVVLEQELAVAVLDDGLGMALDLVYHAEDLSDLGVERRLRAEEDVAVEVGGFVAIVCQLGIGADLMLSQAISLRGRRSSHSIMALVLRR